MRQRADEGEGMRKVLIFAVATSMAFALAGTSPAARSREFAAPECFSATATFPLPREQAQQYLPAGFESGAGTQQSEVPYFYVTSIVCGEEPTEANLTMSAAYLVVNPPERYGTGEPGRFVLAAAIGGAEAPTLQRKLCLDDLFESGDISWVTHFGSANDGDGAFGATVAAKSLAANFDVVTTQSSLGQTFTNSVRWFFRGDKGIEYFDSLSVSEASGLGAGEIRFTKQFMDLPQAATGPASFNHSQVQFFAPGCSR